MRVRGIVYRAHNPAWSFSPLSGVGAAKHGGRFNPVGVPALYISFLETTALAEYQHGFAHRPQPVTLCAYEVDCEDVIDLTDPTQRDRYQIDLSHLAAPWEFMHHNKQMPVTWMLASTMMDETVAGIIVPSYAANAPEGGKNLVLWEWTDQRPHQVILIDDHKRLPRDQSSWKYARRGPVA